MSAGLVEREILVKNLDARPDRILSRKASDFPIPTGREEEWRYAPLARFGGLTTDAAPDVTIQFLARHESAVISRELTREDETTFKSLDRIGARAIENWKTGILIEIPANAEIASPIYVDVNTEKGLAFGHIVVRARENSKATLVIQYKGTGHAAVTLETQAASGAQLDLISLFDS
ncbi:MAG: hypothetical protein ACO3O9_05490, partial [Candidatus Nanopelagicales bacterium]